MNVKQIAEIKVGREYHWNVRECISLLHEGTKTVEVISIFDRRPHSSPLATVKSVQTGEVFSTDVGHLQPAVELLKKKFKGAIKYWKRTGIKPAYLKKIDDEMYWRKPWWDDSTERITHPYVIVINEFPESHNVIQVINSRGHLDSISIGWIPELRHNENAEQKMSVQQERELWEDLLGDPFADYDDAM